MENKDTIYKDDKEESFIKFVFSKDPQPQGTIKLECGLPTEGKTLQKHLYEQLLQIFIEALQFKYGNNDDKVDVTTLEINDIMLMKEFFKSFSVDLQFSIYTKDNYCFKPYIYGNEILEKKAKKISDYHYEIKFVRENITHWYRISFELI